MTVSVMLEWVPEFAAYLSALVSPVYTVHPWVVGKRCLGIYLPSWYCSVRKEGKRSDEQVSACVYSTNE